MKREFRVVDVSQPVNGSRVILNSYWAVIDNKHYALYYGTSPQCNVNKEVIKRISAAYKDSVEKQFNGKLKIIKIDLAFEGQQHYEY